MNETVSEKEVAKILSGKMGRKDFIKLLLALGVVSLVPASANVVRSCKVRGKVVIVGGGAAGMSMVARLSRILKNAEIVLIDPNDNHFYQAGFTLVTAGWYDSSDVIRPQSDFIPSNVKWIKDSVIAIDPLSNKVTTSLHGAINYDFIILTPGLQMNFDKIEGMSKADIGKGNAHCVYDFEGAKRTKSAIEEIKGNCERILFADTYTQIKCAGAPKKMSFIIDDIFRKRNIRGYVVIDYYTPSKKIFSIPFYEPRIKELFYEKDINLHFRHVLKGIDTLSKRAHFNLVKESDEGVVMSPIIVDYDLLHFIPPMSPPNFVLEAQLGEGDEGWVSVDKETLVHVRYNNMICLGDCAGLPTSKTGAAVRKQVPIAVDSLIALMEDRVPTQKYNGYSACPIITEQGKVLLCEYDYNKEPVPSIPFVDPAKEQWLAWVYKRYMLKHIYFDGMLQGYL